MTFTYDPVLVDTDPVQRIRFELGDTEAGEGVLPGGKNLQDEEIEAVLGENGGDWAAAMAALCRILSLRWARYVDTAAGRVKQEASQVSKRYEELARKYEAMAAAGDAGEYGASIAGSLLYEYYDQTEPRM